MSIKFTTAFALKVIAPAIVLLGAVSSYAVVTHTNSEQKSSENDVAKKVEESDNKSSSGGASPKTDTKEQKTDSTPKAGGAPKAKSSAPKTSTPTAPSPGSVVTPTQPEGNVSGGGACSTRPIASSTGSSGTLAADGRTSLMTPGEIIQNRSFSGDLAIYADNVQLKNVNVTGNIVVAEADNVLIDHVTARSIAISSSSNTTIQYAQVNAFEGDSFHITSDGSSYITNVTIKHSYISRPGFNPGSLSHWDGVQIRGANGVTIFCNNFDVGAWQDPYNVLIYLEQANGGNDNVVVDNNWLSGSNFAFMIGLPHVPVNLSITNNKLYSADFHYGYCYLGGGFTPAYLTQVIQTGNTLDGAAMAQVCTEGDL
jgi:cytoskeletal protein RodZ